MTPEPERPLAFVIMPFDLVSDQIFEQLIRPALVRAGFDVARADTTNNLRLIMRDIVEGIQRAKIVVADLSGRNANVFWELGLAHGLRKQVILLARSAADIPFDLGGYRAVIYPVRLEKPLQLDDALSAELEARLEGVTAGEVRFGDPLVDFGISEPNPGTRDDEGLLDDLLALKRDTANVGANIAQVAHLLTSLGTEMTDAESAIGPASPGEEIDHAQAVYTAYAPIWARYAQEFERYVAETLLPMTIRAQRGFPAIVRLGSFGGDEGELRQSLIDSLSEIREPAQEYEASFLKVATTTRQYGQLTSALREPGERLAVALERIASLFQQLGRLGDDLAAAGQ